MLARYPTAKHALKYLYRWLSYARLRDKEIPYLITDGAHLVDPMGIDGHRRRESSFFGYFGISPWSMDGKSYLHHIIRGRFVEVVRIDSTGVSVVGTTPAWSYQQGAMLQWIPGTLSIAYNDIEQDNLGTTILDERGKRHIPWPMQAYHPNGRQGISIDYIGLAPLNSDYAYRVKAKNFPKRESALWTVDLETGSATSAIRTDQLRIPGENVELNHVAYSPDGNNMVFMERNHSKRPRKSRLWISRSSGADPRCILDTGMVSHYTWRDSRRLIAFARDANGIDRYLEIDIKSDEVSVFSPLHGVPDGHPAIAPGGRWLITDTYPDRELRQQLILVDLKNSTVIPVGWFRARPRFSGSKRCDLHPRWNPDGRRISIDSTHDGLRGSWIIDVEGLIGA